MRQRIIDFHAHIFPEKVAAKATASIGAFYDTGIRHSGLAADLLAQGAKIGIERYIVHSTATRSDQVVAINDFIVRESALHGEFVGFGTLHPGMAEPIAEIERIKAAGLRGIKLHPDFQRFAIDDGALDPVYDYLRGGLPILVHAGDRRYDFSGPRRIARVLARFPGIRIIAAHFGGYSEWEGAMEYLVGKDVWFDTSSTLWKLPASEARRMMAAHGYERMLFGSDYPMWDPAEEYRGVAALGLGAEEADLVFYKNALALLGLE